MLVATALAPGCASAGDDAAMRQAAPQKQDQSMGELDGFLGSWILRGELSGAAGEAAFGGSVNVRRALGDAWLSCEVVVERGEATFEASGQLAWDGDAERYVYVWTDSGGAPAQTGPGRWQEGRGLVFELESGAQMVLKRLGPAQAEVEIFDDGGPWLEARMDKIEKHQGLTKTLER